MKKKGKIYRSADGFPDFYRIIDIGPDYYTIEIVDHSGEGYYKFNIPFSDESRIGEEVSEDEIFPVTGLM